MSRFYSSLLLLYCFGAQFAFAQKPTSPSLPSSPSAGVTDYSQESYVIEKWYVTYRFENDGTGQREIYAQVKVQSEAGVEQWGQLVVGYNSANEKLEFPYVKVLKADGSTVSASTDAIQDMSIPLEKEAPVYTDYRQKHVTVPGLRPGEVLEYRVVTNVATALAPGQFWMEHNFAKTGIVLDERLEVNVPSGRTVKLKTAPGNNPKVADENGRRIYRWTSTHLEKDSDDSDPQKKKKAAADPESPAVQMTTFASWEEMGRWYGSLEKDQRTPTPEIRAKAAELTAGKITDLDKIQALYDFVATNFRYVSLSLGVGRYQPHSASDVLHNQYGDCKDKHTLLASLLEASGYHASSVLMNSSRKIDTDIPSPAQFDHVISLVPLGKDEVWMDTTTEVAPFRLLAFTLRKKEGLVIPPGGTPHLEETPADPPMPDTQTQEMTGKVTDFGKLDVHVKYVLRGDTELLMRLVFRKVPNSRWQLLVKQMMEMGGLDGEITDLKVSDPAATAVPFTVEYQMTVANFFDWSKKKSDVRLPLADIRLSDAEEDEPDVDAKPITLGPPGSHSYKLRLEFPVKYEGRAPLPFSMKRDYGTYEASYKFENGVFTAERKLAMSQSELPASRNNDYLAFRRAILADVGQRLSIDTTAAGTPTAPSDLKGDDLKEAAAAAFNNGNYSQAVTLYKKVVETDPKDKNALNNLGRSYMGLRQTDDAVQVFKKQTEMNPYDEYGYSNLGWAYTTERRYDAAEAAFQKAIEINPLSDYAHGALGQMYSENHQYDKAIPELEKAVSLKPDNAFFQINLGDAYLNVGQDEKALAAFDRAVEISANPEVWNNIAYQLSLKGAHLDKAQQYADSAVAAVEVALRNTDLNQLRLRDLGLVSSLMADWDTLGWVYYSKGDLEKAEKYVNAAWMLGQHAEVGDHLGQIYEKRGQKDEALQTYAMALSGIRPSDETRQRLAKLAGGDGKVDSLRTENQQQLQSLRTVEVAAGKEMGAAEYFVTLVPASTGVTVEGAKFISGDPGMKVYTEALRHAKFSQAFPDDSQTKIVRRGVLSCSQSAGCHFVMMLPDDVRSTE